MGSDFFEEQEGPSLRGVKVHFGMCKELMRLVDTISSIFPQIEAARPGSLPGMQALCLLQKSIQRAKEHIQNCCDSSKLYLAITGEAILKRFEKTRNHFLQSLSKLQGMVPVVLASQISEVLYDIEAAVFFLDSNEELAGKALRALLERGVSPVNSVGNSELELLQFGASVLHISSQRDILLEQRSFKKLLRATKEEDSTKRRTLTSLLHILQKYDKQIVQGQTRDRWTQAGRTYLPLNSDSESVTARTPERSSRPNYAQDRARTRIHHQPSTPEDFKCYLTSSLMHDPVKISSGHTFERTYIQKWFDEGHDTCPKSKKKLPDLSMESNTTLRDLILKWSVEHNVVDPKFSTSELSFLDISSNSMCSTASSLRDLHLQVDISNISLGSLGSLDSSCNSISHAKSGDSFCAEKEATDAKKFLFNHDNEDIKRQFLRDINRLPWETQCRAVQDVYNYLIRYNPSCSFVSSENFLDPLLLFLQDSLNKHDIEAQKAGIQLLLTFLKSSRMDTLQIDKDVYTVLASFLATEAAIETLATIEVLSTQATAITRFTVSCVLTPIVDFLDSRDRELQDAALRILYNLSQNIDASSCKVASDWIPKLVRLLGCDSVAGTCICILDNLSKPKETRVAITETEGCIASIIDLLQSGCAEETQEHAVGILLSLCAHIASCGHLVLHEGGIPALVQVSNNGNDKAKSRASELLRLLRHIEYEPEQKCPEADTHASEDQPENSDQVPTRTSRLCRWQKKLFLKKK